MLLSLCDVLLSLSETLSEELLSLCDVLLSLVMCFCRYVGVLLSFCDVLLLLNGMLDCFMT